MKAAPRGIQVNIIHYHSLLNFAYKTQLRIGRGWEGDVDKRKTGLREIFQVRKEQTNCTNSIVEFIFFPLSYFRDTV